VDESFLHFIWQLQYFNKESLLTTQGEKLSIFRPGHLNTNAGPDFQQAKLCINEVEWHGDVEIHIQSSDWNKHKHQADATYNKVILHVVWEDDQSIFRPDGTPIPTLELKKRIAPTLLNRYHIFLGNKAQYTSVPCAKLIHQVPELIRLSMIERALMQRLEKKAAFVHHLLERNQGHWEETTYQLVCKNFGFKLNSEAFLALGKAVPKKYIDKHKDQLHSIEALLFGQAGFLDELPEIKDHYGQSLKKEYTYLSRKYGLGDKKLALHQWKFMRLRPANFPTLRIAQISRLLFSQNHLFSLFTEATSYQELYNALKIQQSAYWQNHYKFGVPVVKQSKEKKRTLGKTSIENIIVNTAVPLLVAYAKVKDEDRYLDKAIALLQQIPPESNKTTRMWKDLGMNVHTAFDTQALIELYNSFCIHKKCLSCSIGVAIIKGE
jgi:hypothetical protein